VTIEPVLAAAKNEAGDELLGAYPASRDMPPASRHAPRSLIQVCVMHVVLLVTATV
jgi:hypothetical protein